MTLLKNEATYVEMNLKIKNKLDEIKKEWFEKINSLVSMSRDLDKLPEVQVLLLSYRHQLTDYCYGDLAKGNISAKSIYEKNKKACMLDSKTNFDFKLNTEKERFIVIDADIRIIDEMLDMFEAQTYFVRESIKLLDNLGYSVKSRIEMYKIMNGDGH